jgi:hypothetical protein
VRRYLSIIAPRCSRRRLLLSIARDFFYRPHSIFGRLAPTNFHNNRICARTFITCCVCGHHGSMHYDFPDVPLYRRYGVGLLRETSCCQSCGATMRDRQIAFGLLRVIAERLGRTEANLRALRLASFNTLRILDTDSFSPINRVLRGLPGYKYSQFRPDLPNGAIMPDGSLNANLLDMPFGAGSFEVIITSDVMEHIADDERAHREIFRCLAPGGAYVFTVPYDPCLMVNRQLTQDSGSSNAPFFLDKHVHGDPHSGSGIIAHRIYGQQLMTDLSKMGYETRFESIRSPTMGIFGGDLFIASKPH